jgi:hypothetical protein
MGNLTNVSFLELHKEEIRGIIMPMDKPSQSTYTSDLSPQKKTLRFLSFPSIAVFLFCAAVFGSVLAFDVETDVQLHMRFLHEIINGERAMAPNFMYYSLVYVLSLFQDNLLAFYCASTVVLAVATAAKFAITRHHIEKIAGKDERLSVILAVCLLFAFSLPWPGFNRYVGQIPSNVWHNPTTTLLMPFALLLFFASYNQIVNAEASRIKIILALVILNVVAKPSFFFVFSVAYPFFLLLKFRLTKTFWVNLLPIVAGFIALYLSYYFIYETQEQIKVVVDILKVWRIYSPNIPASLALSAAFPAAYIVLYWRDSIKDVQIQYAALLYAGSLMVFSLFAEKGREGHGNFMWQCIVTSYIIFAVLAANFGRKLAEGKRSYKEWIAGTLFALHVVSGVLYLGKFFIFKHYGF